MNRVRGWDERDYKLWSQIQCLQSYGLAAGHKMIREDDVVAVMENQAKQRAIAEELRKEGKP